MSTDPKRLTGPQAGVQKYDLLTALAVAGLNGTSGFQTSMLRLVALVTARYNWKADEFTVGQRELARMWAVDERTVKREIKRLTLAGIIVQLRPGVRGRVAAYRLDRAEIHRLSAPYWSEVGPDFEDRMTQFKPEQPEDKVVRIDFRARPSHDDVGTASWERTLLRLAESDPDVHRSWYSGLSLLAAQGDTLQLRASSAFIGQYIATHHLQPLLDVARLEFPNLRRVLIIH